MSLNEGGTKCTSIQTQPTSNAKRQGSLSLPYLAPAGRHPCNKSTPMLAAPPTLCHSQQANPRGNFPCRSKTTANLPSAPFPPPSFGLFVAFKFRPNALSQIGGISCLSALRSYFSSSGVLGNAKLQKLCFTTRKQSQVGSAIALENTSIDPSKRPRGLLFDACNRCLKALEQ